MDIADEEPATTEPGPYGAGLWAVAHYWVGVLACIFEPDAIATTGITRSFALRCRNWLWAIEGFVRRLIIAAARSFEVDERAPAIPRTGPHTTRPVSSIAFQVLPRLPGRGSSSRTEAAQPRTPQHRHLAFPGDGLLSLFPHHGRRNAPAVSTRTLNPLHRRGRRHRHDPDYQGERPAPFRSQPVAGGPRRERCMAAAPWWEPKDHIPEWKRVEFEWERVIASPRLAQRISALVRVMAHPERIIARTARQLRGDTSLIARLCSLPPPIFRKPKLDRGPVPPLLDELPEAHKLAFDTS